MSKTLDNFARHMFNAGFRRGNGLDDGCSPEDFGEEEFVLAMVEWTGLPEDDAPPEDGYQWPNHMGLTDDPPWHRD